MVENLSILVNGDCFLKGRNKERKESTDNENEKKTSTQQKKIKKKLIVYFKLKFSSLNNDLICHINLSLYC